MREYSSGVAMRADGYPGSRSGAEGFFGVLADPQSYLNIVYLLFSFPLGLFYFILLITGITVGISLAILLIGLVVLFLTLLASRGLAAWERQLSIWLLEAHIPPQPRLALSTDKAWDSFKAILADSFTWRGFLFLMLKFPLGIISFVITVFFVAMTLSLLLTPLVYHVVPVTIGLWRITSLEAALLCLACGLLLGILSIYVMNGLAFVWRALAMALLGPPRGEVAAPARQGPIIIP
jgi:hypothetical protein